VATYGVEHGGGLIWERLRNSIQMLSPIEHISDYRATPSKSSSIETKSILNQVRSKFDSIGNQLTDLMARCKLVKPAEDQVEVAQNIEKDDELIIIPTIESPDFMIACRSISHITTLFPFFIYENNCFKCTTCIQYLAPNLTTTKSSR
jgi:arsenate reductase-like glutaredoxin family protein